MKTAVKLALLFLIILSVFTSCSSYRVMHYTRNEIEKVSPDIDKYNVYIHDKNNSYQVGNPGFSPAGIKGKLTLLTDSASIAEIKHPRTKKLLKKHQHDLNVYTKTEIKDKPNEIILKKADVTDITHVASKANIGEDIGTGLILSLGVVVIIGIVYAFHGLL